MSKKIKQIDPYAKVRKVSYPFSSIVRCASFFFKKFNHLKIVKLNKLPEPPYILISTHGSIMDFCAGIEVTKPHHPYWICSVEEFYDKNFILTRFGAIPKRKFTNDPYCAEKFMEILTHRKKILVFYPEARYSFVGHEERIDEGIGKLAKMCDVPVVFISCHGDFLWNPQWGDKIHRHIKKLTAEVKTIVTLKQVREMTSDEINIAIKDCFKYDDEQYQLDNGLKNKYINRAVGLHRILYKCPHCGTESEMTSRGKTLKCSHCGVSYTYEEDGTLSCDNAEAKFTKVSDWYYWEKDEVRKEVESGKFHFEDDVKVELLRGVGIGFVRRKGHYHMVFDYDGIRVNGIDKDFAYSRSSLQSYAIHIEYNYRHRGDAIDLSTNTETYFVYPLTRKNVITKIHFAVECMYDYQKNKIGSVN